MAPAAVRSGSLIRRRRSDALVAVLTSLHAALVEHLDLEERALPPLAASSLTPPELAIARRVRRVRGTDQP